MLTSKPMVEMLLEAVAHRGDAELTDLRVGAFWTLVRTSVGCGMASSMRSERHIHGSKPIRDAGSLHERTPLELADLLRSDSVPERAVGLAAVNALLGPPEGVVTEANARSILAERGAGQRVAMIGHFPFAERLAETCDQLWVFERGDGRRDDDLGEERMGELLPRADVVAVTSTSIINHTLPGILERVRADTFVMLLGPSTPLVPALFDLGIDVLCGSVVTDPGAVLRAVEQGAVTRQIGGVRRVCLWRQ